MELKLIDVVNHKRVKLTLFPDNQPHVDLIDIKYGDVAMVFIRLSTANDVLHMLQIADALGRIGAKKKRLHISYLMGARYDRSMREGDSVDLKVISKLINSCEFEEVILLDPHSSTALQLIDRSKELDNQQLVSLYDMPDATLIVPDAGATRKVDDYLKWNSNIKRVAYCIKKRDLDTGKVNLQVIQPELISGNVVIIDDICDGGATFLAISDQVDQSCHKTLIVTHGIFSKGLSRLFERFDQIITTNSYKDHNPRKGLIVVKV